MKTNPLRKRDFERDGYDATTEGAAQFFALVTSLARQLEVDLDATLGFLPIEVDEVDFMLLHGEDWGDENLAIVCEFGEVPRANRERVLEAALVANHQASGLASPVFAIDPQADVLTLTAAVPLPGLDPEALLATLAKYVVLAHHWQRTHFVVEAT